jgi:hypothetical protein
MDRAKRLQRKRIKRKAILARRERTREHEARADKKKQVGMIRDILQRKKEEEEAKE